MTDANPFVGPRPFEVADRDRFFGRTGEISQLTSLVISHRVLIVYAQSGAGKTSLLNAGLTPSLEDEGFEVYPVTRVAGLAADDPLAEQVGNIYTFNALAGLIGEGAHPEPAQTMADFFAARPHVLDADDEPMPRVVVVDQFEELFTVYPGRWREREEFFGQIRRALAVDPLIRVIFSLREDFLAQLDPHLPTLREFTMKRFRLDRLRKAGALSALVDPLRTTRRSFAKGVAENLVGELMQIRVEIGGASREVPGEYVEPVQLQVVGETLWDGLPDRVDVIDAVHVRDFGDVTEALTVFYESAVDETVDAAGVKESTLRHWFDSTLITQAGTRGTVYQGPEQTGGLSNDAVAALEDAHVIRGESQRGSRWFELTHDRFVGPIRASNQTFRDVRRRKRTKLALFAGAVVAVVGAVVMAVIGGAVIDDSEGLNFRTIELDEPVTRTLEGRDAFRVEAGEDQVIDVEVTSEMATFQVGLFRITDGQLGAALVEPATSVAADKDGLATAPVTRQTVSLSAQVPAPGAYTIEVAGPARGTYTVEYRITKGRTRQELTVGTARNGRLETSDQIDQYVIVGTAGDLVEIVLPPAQLDGMIRLVGTRGAEIGFVDGASSEEQERLVRILPADGRYLVSVEGFQGSLGEYTIELRRPAVADIVFGDAAEVTAVDGEASSTTFYKFSGEATRFASLVLTVVDGAGGTLELTSPSGLQLGSAFVSAPSEQSGADDDDHDGTVLLILPEDGTYLVQVSLEAGSSATLQLRRPEPPEIGVDRPGAGELSGPGDSTAFRYAGTAGDVVTIEAVVAAGAGLAGQVELTAPSTQRTGIVSFGFDGAVPLQAILPQDGEYLVSISAFDGAGDYELRVSAPTPPPIPLGGTVTGTIEPAGTTRYHLIEGSREGVVRLELGGAVEALIVLNDDDGFVSRVDAQATVRVGEGEPVLVGVAGVDGSTGSYTLVADRATITPTDLGETVEGVLEPGGVAFFEFPAVEGSGVKVAVSGDGLGDPVIELNFDGLYSFESRPNNDPELAVAAPVGGTHLVQVSDGSGGSGAFTLTLKEATVEEIFEFDQSLVVAGSGEVAAGEFGDVSDAVELQPVGGAPVEATGSVTADGQPPAVYSFCASAGDVALIAMDVVDGTLDPVLTLYTEEGFFVAGDDDSGGDLNSLIAQELPSDACYFVFADYFDRTGAGAYRVEVSVDPAT